jgi:PKD repeat protein
VTGGTPSSPSGNPITILWGSGSTGFITVVISGGSCQDSISQQICLLDGPQANFTAVPNPVCDGVPVNFTNTSAGGGSYLWDFGDGTTSTLANPPAHVFPGPGFYTVILTAFDMGSPKQGGDLRTPCGCSDTISQVIEVLSGAGPTIETTCCYGTVCPGDTSSFCTPLVCGTYNWTVANGVIISGAGTSCIKVKWDAVYTVPPSVSLAVPGCGAAPCPGSTTLNVPVLYPNLPISGPSPLCVGSAGSFFLPSMPGTFYQWTTTAPAGSYTFNDADRNVANVNMTFNQAGTFLIQCNYNNPMAGCSGSSVFSVDVLPVFSIFGNDKVCQYSAETYFGSGSATWSVTGPGAVTPSPVVGNPTSMTFSVPGTYIITATPPPGIYCNLSAVKVVQVVAVPIVNPIAGPPLVCPGQNSTFTVSSNTTGSPFSWSVVFGTGSVQTQFGPDESTAIIKLTGGPTWTIQVVQQIEISPGVFCSSLPQNLVVNAYGPPVFNPAPPSLVCVDAVTSFSVTGASPVQWTVSPPNLGSIISGQGTNTVNIRWNGPGPSATVTATNCGGSVSTVVNITNPPVIGPITANDPFSYCLPSMPNNLILSTTPGYSYQWSGPFGNFGPNSPNCPVPNGYFTGAGVYYFSVTASNGSCSVTKTAWVLIENPPCNGGIGIIPTCTVDFSINPNPACQDQPVTFTAIPSGPGFQFTWDFGDPYSTSYQDPTQHTYTAPGLYTVTLTATLGNCTAVATDTVRVHPTPVCNITVNDTMYCPGSFVTFAACPGQASYQWYKDGTLISGATSSGYNAYQYGDYWVEVSNSYGCTNTSNHIFIYERALPTARITGEGTVCSYPGSTESFQLSAFFNANYSYAWSSNPPGATFSPNNSNGSFITTASITLPLTLPYTCAFIVKVTDTVTGCENFDTLCVTFYETPALSVTFASGCEGTPYTLTPTPNNPALYHYQWSNGKTTPVITVSTAGNYALTITDLTTGCTATALAAMIHPRPDLSLFPRGCDTICHTDSIRMYIPLPLNALPPFNTYATAYSSITWYDNGNWGSPVGSGPSFYFSSAVLGSHQISVIVVNHFGCADTAGVFCLNVIQCDTIIGLDFGDAPDSPSSGFNYQTLLPNGARHGVVPGIFMGTLIDTEANGQPTIPANGDDINNLADEDGVAMPAVVTIGSTYSITVSSSVAGFVDAWIDYNIDGTWVGPGEKIFTSQPVPGILTFTVPATATMGQSYARFRFRTASPPVTYNGYVSNGEVEDYPVFINECCEGEELDFGDAPDMPKVGFSYPTFLASNGARHVVCSNIRLGALIDAELDGQPNTTATGDDNANLPDEDGVQFVGMMYVGMPANIKVTASISGFLNAFMDFNKDGDWSDPGEQIFTNQPLAAGVNNLSFIIPATAQHGKTYSRFRFNTLGGLTYFGLALNGEVEDYRVQTCPHWWPVHTNVKHYITIPHDLHNMYPGDVLGVFYQGADGMLACGGLSEFTGTDDQMMIAYGDNLATTVKDGFTIGEPIIWKLCSIIKGDANPVDVVWDFTYPSHNGLFAQNGLSALTDINGLHVTALAMPGTVCTGEEVQLHAELGNAEGVAFSWTSDPAGFTSDLQNPVDIPAGNTTYTVDAFDGVFHSYSSVSVKVTQVNPLVEVLPLKNISIANGENSCFNATQTITVAGNGSVFIVENGGNAQFIAGQHIRLLPGTRGFPGSYLHAYITATGAYCCGTLAPVKETQVTEPVAIVPADDKSFFKVYPNPTTGNFTLELKGTEVSERVSVEIYGILGEKILTSEMNGSKQRVFDLSGRQHGVYLVRVMNGGEMGMTKIIKQ